MAFSNVLTNNYVKFVRTTPTIWANLTNPDNDTLYFVLVDGSNEGSLYLGRTLIATSVSAGLSLTQLNDVLAGVLQNNDILVYSSSAQQWINAPISDFQPVAMVGATEEDDGEGGLVPVPVAGQQGLFLRGDGQWADPTTGLVADVNDLASTVGDIQTALSTVIGADTGKSMQAVAAEVASAAIANVVAGAPEAFDTLKEIADWILGTDGPNVDAADIITDVNALKSEIYGESEDDGLIYRVGSLETDVESLNTAFASLNNFVRGEDNPNSLYAVVTNHTSLLAEQATQIADNSDAIEVLDQRLRWITLEEVNE